MTTVRMQRPDGVNLTLEVCGDGHQPSMVFAHGFGQTRRIWRPAMATMAAAGWRCVSFDMRGHGDSDWSRDGHYAIDDFLDDLAAVTAAQPRPPILVGASMGGLLSLGLSGERKPSVSSALVLVDATPRMQTPGIERILGFMRAAPEGFAHRDEALRAIAAFQPQRNNGGRRAADVDALLRTREDGRLVWHWDPGLLHALAVEGTRQVPRLLAAAAGVAVPTLLISGGRSDVVSAATIDEFLQLLPRARHVRLADATHSVVGDAGNAFVDVLRDFVASLSGSGVKQCPATVI